MIAPIRPLAVCAVLSGLSAGLLLADRDATASPRTLVEDPETGAAVDVARGDAAEADAFFTDDVLPVLESRCFRCHGPDKERVRGGLRMNGRASLVHGGDEGPAIDLEDPASSALLERLRTDDFDLVMPPDGALPEEEIAVIEAWLAMGAPWPGSGDPPPREGAIDHDAARGTWPFVPLARPAVPTVDGVAHPIDAFVVDRLRAEGIAPAPRASDRTLVRRVFFDLLGLPPTIEEVEAYAADPSPDKWKRLIDDLLARREYAERQARRWLDVMRYAETNAYEHDELKPYAWRYRDYVIDAFDEDRPYDEFLREQIAGDELEEAGDRALVATGWYHLGHHESEPSNPRLAEQDYYDDVTRVITEGFLGLTVGCARCHDHRFDAITQEDYYGMVGFVRNVEPYRRPEFALDSPILTPVDLDDERRAEWDRDRAAFIAALEAERDELHSEHRKQLLADIVSEAPAAARRAFTTVEHNRTAAQRKQYDALLAKVPTGEAFRQSLKGYKKIRIEQLKGTISMTKQGLLFEGDLEWVLRVRERDGAPLPTHLMKQGDPDRPGNAVEPRFLPVLVADDAAARPDLPATGDADTSSGRRTALAAWITAPDHPMTARVMANRVWQAHFGRGIVPTPNDFGAGGEPATHPELLDWLAAEFVANGWSVKRLHRTILTSEAYRRASSWDDAAAREADPANRLLWRQNLRRLQAEELRDALFAVSDSLTDCDGGPSFYPRLSREALAGASKPGNGWGVSTDEERRRRSVYAFVKRGLPLPFFQAFDGPSGDLQTGRRQSTTTSMQSLMLWNGALANDAAARLARRTADLVGDADARADRVVALYELALAKRPDAETLDACLRFLERATAHLADTDARLVFEPLVPSRLQDDFLDALPDDEFLYGPRSWTYVKGRWDNWYNNTRELDPDRGMAALSPVPVGHGRVSARVVLGEGARDASFYLRAHRRDDCVAGIEVRLVPETRELVIVEHPWMPQRAVIERARIPIPLEVGTAHAIAMELRGGTVRVAWDGRAVVEFEGLTSLRPGVVGVSCRGDSFEVGGLQVEEGGVTTRVTGDPAVPAADRAFTSLCLSVLNTNEFLYVD